MADIEKGQVFANTDKLTPAALNNLFSSATIVPGFITGKVEDVAPDWTTDSLVEYKASQHALRQVKGSSMAGYKHVLNYFQTLNSGGRYTDYPVDKERAVQAAEVTLTSNSTLRIFPMTEGVHMQGQLLVIQDGIGGNRLTTQNLTRNMLPGLPPDVRPVDLPIGTVGNTRTMLTWFYLYGTFVWGRVTYF